MLRLRQFLGAPFFTPFINFITILEAHRSLDVWFLMSFFIADHLWLKRSRWFTVIHQSCGSCREFGTSPKIMVSHQKRHLFSSQITLVTTDVLNFKIFYLDFVWAFWCFGLLCFCCSCCRIVVPWFGNIHWAHPPRDGGRGLDLGSPDGKSSQVGQSRCDWNGRCGVMTSDQKVNCWQAKKPPLVRALCSEQGSWKITKLPHFFGDQT